jgi:flagellar basal body rod protein FlgG
MNKETGKEFTDENGNKITGSKKFTASETGDGTVDVEFKFNAKALKMQGTTIVAFETCMPFESEIPVGVHADITDVEQTVYIPDAHTNASITDFSDLSKIKLTDEVIYTNLIPNKTYIVRGYIVDKDGKEINVKSEKEFTPTTKDGTVDVNFEFNAENLSGKYVVFEEIFAKSLIKMVMKKKPRLVSIKILKMISKQLKLIVILIFKLLRQIKIRLNISLKVLKLLFIKKTVQLLKM